MDFFKKKSNAQDASQQQVDMAAKILNGFNEILDRHKKEIELLCPQNHDKLNLLMLLQIMALTSHCEMTQACGAKSREQQLDDIYKSVLETWADKRNQRQ